MSSRLDPTPSAGGKRERTRAALVGATLDVVAEKGFAAASLDEIAARAGMTKGAIYSNFSGKGELLMAAIAAKGLTVSSDTPAEAPLREQFAGMARGLADMLQRARGEAAFLAEFQVYALGDPELRRNLASVYAQSFDLSAEHMARAGGLKPGMAPRHVAVALQSVAIGFVVQSFLSPDDVTEEIVTETLAALAAGLIAKRR
ncbi:TetR/AcrR family transcriptional regulator [Phenylobacterium sp.]|uniref:TetR/AcrR family transcriptional regulator n=1 Tax=Phenylobacterium sp. TaxID=1871053 RepID=UPI0025FC5F33|nr:TetR/AcrR family transcriptional regulator [Phenylobacterium sp.]